jgi:hypothetical protein
MPRWGNVTQIIGQLKSYNKTCPRPQLQAYMFEPLKKQDKMQHHADLIASEGIRVFNFEFITLDDKDLLCIVDFVTKSIVYTQAM